MVRFSLVAVASLFLCLIPQSVVSLAVGDELCIQGFIMDYFCIDNVRMIDNGRVTLEEPDRHTVHCLVDVGICLNSAFEILIKSEPGASTTYSRGYRLDDDSKNDILNLARSVGSCSTCVNGYDSSKLNRGFKSVMKVTVLDMNPNDSEGAPPLVRVNERKDSSSLGSDPCQSEYGMAEGVPVSTPTMAPVNPPTPTPPPTKAPTVPQTQTPVITSTPLPTVADTSPIESPTVDPNNDGTSAPAATSPTVSPSTTSTGDDELTDSASGMTLLWSFVVACLAFIVM